MCCRYTIRSFRRALGLEPRPFDFKSNEVTHSLKRVAKIYSIVKECRPEGHLAGKVGLEPTTLELTAPCSTIELHPNLFSFYLAPELGLEPRWGRINSALPYLSATLVSIQLSWRKERELNPRTLADGYRFRDGHITTLSPFHLVTPERLELSRHSGNWT